MCPPTLVAQALVLRCCLDRGVPAEAKLATSGLAEEQREFVLALRGLLAFGVLEHCLRMRVHVEFGVNRCGRRVGRWGRQGGQCEPEGKAADVASCAPQPCKLSLLPLADAGRYVHLHMCACPAEASHDSILRPRRSPNARKRLAVPYRAAHTPSERSEYARPDTALTLTALAYYKDGLSPGEFSDALHELLRRGQNEQRACFAEWLQLARRDVEDAGGHNGLLVIGAGCGCPAGCHLPGCCLRLPARPWLTCAALPCKAGGWRQLRHGLHCCALLVCHKLPSALGAGVLVPVDDVRKLDPTNAVQMGLAHSIFSHNMAGGCSPRAAWLGRKLQQAWGGGE